MQNEVSFKNRAILKQMNNMQDVKMLLQPRQDCFFVTHFLNHQLWCF